MFAVPGWTLTTKNPVVSKDRPSSKKTGSRAEDAPRPKKRKRESVAEERPSDVTAATLDKVWNDQSPGETVEQVVSPKKKKKPEKQSQKNGDVPGTEETGSKASKARGSQSKANSGSRELSGPTTANAKPHGKGGIDSRTHSEQQTKSKVNHNASNANSSSRDHSIKESKLKSIDPAPAAPPAPAPKLTPLQQSMRAKLISARFRHLNEALYTSPSEKALAMFSENPEMFAEYHAGFSQQVKDSWPENPVDLYIHLVKTRAKIPFKLGKDGKMPDQAQKQLPLPRRPHGTCTIADLGCGDAQLARGLQSSMKNLNLKFHNFDLHAANSLVTKADISSLPLRDGETDVVIFCLSLMGTNWISFVEEAWRVLRGDGKGEVWVAEVKSRFGRAEQKKKGMDEQSKKKQQKRSKAKKHKDGDDGADDQFPSEEVFAEIDGNSNNTKDETDISGFIEVFRRRGFNMRPGSINKDNKMFVSMVFTKMGVPLAGKWKGMKWTGTRYERIGLATNNINNFKQKAFLDRSREDITPEEEAKVLKPCVYKLR